MKSTEYLGIFEGLEEEKILAIRDKAVAMILEGKTIMSTSVGGKGFGKQFSMNPKEVLFEAKETLRRLSPSEYGPKISRMATDFRGVTSL